MKCLCCNKEINNPTESEMKTGWHISCVKKFFNTSTFPLIDINEKKLKELLLNSINRGATVTGVQKKFSLQLTKENTKRLTLVNYPSGYILKPQSDNYKYLPEYEHLTMLMAKLIGIKVVPSALIKINNQYAYITKRIDRSIIDNGIQKIAMEDFQQLNMRLAEDKYKGSYEICSKIIKEYSSQEMLDISEFYLRLLFSYITGNSDMHLKNFSLIEDEHKSRRFKLSPAYDLLPVNLIVPSDKEEVALTLHGKKKNITLNDFLNLANNIGLNEKVAHNLIKVITNKKKILIDYINNFIFLDKKRREEYIKLISIRINRLQNV